LRSSGAGASIDVTFNRWRIARAAVIASSISCSVRRRLDLQLALASAVAARTAIAVLILRAKQMADFRAARRLQREQARARAELIDVLDRIDAETALDTGDLVTALLGNDGRTPDEALLGE
jgi:hypothetical protein